MTSTRLEKKFLCSARFAQEIEGIVSKDKMSYIDAIIYYCEKNAIELDSVPKLISKPLKEKLKWGFRNSISSKKHHAQDCPYDCV